MRRLTLDISLTGTGWAYRSARGHLGSGTVSFADRATKHPGEPLDAFERWLIDRMGWGVDEVVIERPWSSRVRPNPVLQKLVAIAEMVAFRRNVPVELTSPATVKAVIAGHGHADKEQVQAAVEAIIGRPVSGDDNEADAIAILLTAEAGRLHAEKKPKKRARKKCNPSPSSTVQAGLFDAQAPKKSVKSSKPKRPRSGSVTKS